MYKVFISAITFLMVMVGIVKSPLHAPKEREYIICHSTDLPDDMAVFASDPAFQALHLSPLKINYQAKGAMVKFSTPDGTDASGYLIKSKKKSNKWLFVYQEWWGLNDQIKKEADKFYDDLGGNVNVLALDMYDGKSTADPKEAGQFMQSVKQERLESIVKGGLGLAGKKAKIASVGWCFGGGWSLKSALLEGQQNVGCVMYYGMPVREVEKLKTLNSDVLGLFATEQYITKEIIEDFDAKMKEAGKKLEYKIFPGVHGFANPSNPKYDKALASEAYGMALGYLKKKYGV
ncbi:MAG TPA: dienelactone hydrolase family protein [Chitinophagaceae bacterium]|nr:dienelactone hydrolase family protein [Chitinophagaceae bacterium]